MNTNELTIGLDLGDRQGCALVAAGITCASSMARARSSPRKFSRTRASASPPTPHVTRERRSSWRRARIRPGSRVCSSNKVTACSSPTPASSLMRFVFGARGARSPLERGLRGQGFSPSGEELFCTDQVRLHSICFQRTDRSRLSPKEERSISLPRRGVV